ncbi:hypothetical protein BHE90_010101 [Fusarium euwallaceae]|uniref:Uncharacterized protein n=1 Tax=Fusarium euwallaceae TaxID=1147111 RepID=A0A430LID1_9HYPO|nr:hypothetical protein BHE90_010101 [Fusarium euwallaceae]
MITMVNGTFRMDQNHNGKGSSSRNVWHRQDPVPEDVTTYQGNRWLGLLGLNPLAAVEDRGSVGISIAAEVHPLGLLMVDGDGIIGAPGDQGLDIAFHNLSGFLERAADAELPCVVGYPKRLADQDFPLMRCRVTAVEERTAPIPDEPRR